MKNVIKLIALASTSLAMSGCIADGTYYVPSVAHYGPPAVVAPRSSYDYEWRHRRWCRYHRYHPSCRPRVYRRDNVPHYGASRPSNVPHYGGAPAPRPDNVPHYGPAN